MSIFDTLLCLFRLPWKADFLRSAALTFVAALLRQRMGELVRCRDQERVNANFAPRGQKPLTLAETGVREIYFRILDGLSLNWKEFRPHAQHRTRTEHEQEQNQL